MSPYLPILAFDTAAQQCAVALLGDGIALERIESRIQGQSERLLPLIQDVLRENGLRFADVAAVAVTTGPGSFTGLRVALAAAHGIGLAQKCPVIGIDGFAAFNASLPGVPSGNRAIVIESRRAELYWAVLDEAGKTLRDPACAPLAEIVAYLDHNPMPVCGDGVKHLGRLLPHLAMIDQTPGPSPLAIARLGIASLERGPPQGLPAPLYIRPPDARPRQ